MLQTMLDQLKSQDQAIVCVADQKQRLETEVHALRFQRNSALPAKKQLNKALSSFDLPINLAFLFLLPSRT